MTIGNRFVVRAAMLVISIVGVTSAFSFAAPDLSGTEVVLDVTRVVASGNREGLPPQYLCVAKLLRADGEILAQPKVQVLQGLAATITTTTNSGIKVVLKVVVSSPTRVSYEIELTSPEGAREHHRATIGLPE